LYGADENYVENCVTCLTDSPDVHIVSLPYLRPQLKVNAVHLVGRYVTDIIVHEYLLAASRDYLVLSVFFFHPELLVAWFERV